MGASTGRGASWGWRSPLPAKEALGKVRSLGVSDGRDGTDVPTESDCMAPTLRVTIDDHRPCGSHVHACLRENRTGSDFRRAVLWGLSGYAVFIACWAAFSLQGHSRMAALVAVAGTLTFVAGLFELLHRAGRAWAERDADVTGTRERIRRLLSGL